jgi:hypothetical protein
MTFSVLVTEDVPLNTVTVTWTSVAVVKLCGGEFTVIEPALLS